MVIGNKRGLSQVVTTVIIILLVLAAIAIIWSFVRPVIESSSQQVSVDCQTMDLEIVGCDVSDQDIIIRRNVGQGTMTGYKLVWDNGTVEDFVANIDQLNSVTLITRTFVATQTIRVAAVTEQRTCEPLRVAYTCQA